MKLFSEKKKQTTREKKMFAMINLNRFRNALDCNNLFVQDKTNIQDYVRSKEVLKRRRNKNKLKFKCLSLKKFNRLLLLKSSLQIKLLLLLLISVSSCLFNYDETGGAVFGAAFLKLPQVAVGVYATSSSFSPPTIGIKQLTSNLLLSSNSLYKQKIYQPLTEFNQEYNTSGNSIKTISGAQSNYNLPSISVGQEPSSAALVLNRGILNSIEDDNSKQQQQQQQNERALRQSQGKYFNSTFL